MKIPFVHRKTERDCTHQGFNWNSDEYTLFQFWIHIWRLRCSLRIRRKSAFGKFTKDFPQSYWRFDFLDVYKDGYQKLDRNLWECFDKGLYKLHGEVYSFEQLPEHYQFWLATQNEYSAKRLADIIKKKALV